MLEERALVIATHENQATIRTQRLSACESCQLKSGCGTHSFAKLSGNQSMELDVANSLQAKPGDIVMVAIPEQALLQASLLMYFLPLLSMLLFVLAMHQLTDLGELWLLLGVVGGLGLGVLLARRFAPTAQRAGMEPRMTALAISGAQGGACQIS